MVNSILDILPLVPIFCDGIANIVEPAVPNVRLHSDDNSIRMQERHFKTETYKRYFTNIHVIAFFCGTLCLLILE